MLKNQSVPVDSVLPHVTYQNVAEAIAWLAKTFGFVEHYRYGESDGRVEGAQMHLGDAWIMLNSARPGRASPAQTGCGTQSLTIFVEDVDGHCERTKSAGARIVEDLHETVYGERQYGVEDLEGHHWLFSRHARNVSPEEWGAKIAGLGSQASLYARAKAVLAESLPLLDGLYALAPDGLVSSAGAEDLANLKLVPRSADGVGR